MDSLLDETHHALVASQRHYISLGLFYKGLCRCYVIQWRRFYYLDMMQSFKLICHNVLQMYSNSAKMSETLPDSCWNKRL